MIRGCTNCNLTKKLIAVQSLSSTTRTFTCWEELFFPWQHYQISRVPCCWDLEYLIVMINKKYTKTYHKWLRCLIIPERPNRDRYIKSQFYMDLAWLAILCRKTPVGALDSREAHAIGAGSLETTLGRKVGVKHPWYPCPNCILVLGTFNVFPFDLGESDMVRQGWWNNTARLAADG